jgi:hypothetical protein
MKFWKHTLISALVFTGLSSSVLYTACTKDSCEKLNCKNGSVCTDDFCVCPEGYQGTECQEEVSAKFLGFYDGNTKCDELPVIIDSAFVSHGGEAPNSIIYKVFSQKLSTENILYAKVLNEKMNQAYAKDDALKLTTEITKDADKIIINMRWTKDDGKSTQCTFTGTPRGTFD